MISGDWYPYQFQRVSVRAPPAQSANAHSPTHCYLQFSSRLGSLVFYRMQSFLVLTLRTGLRKKLYTNVWFLFTKKAIGSSQNSSAVQTGLIHVIGLDFRFARWYDRFQF